MIISLSMRMAKFEFDRLDQTGIFQFETNIHTHKLGHQKD